MSFSIENNRISLTRGDTLRTTVEIIRDGVEYIPQEGDVIKFAVKQAATDAEELISKIIPNDTMELHIEPEDTKSLAFGNYKYDMQITFANGDVYTFITPSAFVLTEEIG